MRRRRRCHRCRSDANAGDSVPKTSAAILYDREDLLAGTAFWPIISPSAFLFIQFWLICITCYSISFLTRIKFFFSIQFNWINICLLIPHPFNIDLSYITSSLLNEWRISIRSRESLILGFKVPPLRLPSDLPAPEALRNICKRLRRRELCGISYGASLCMPLSATLCSRGEVTTRPTSVSLHSVLASPCSFSSRIKSRRFWKPPISHIIH